MSGIDQVHHFFHAAVGPGVGEQPVRFTCEGDDLLGILARPQQPAPCGVLIAVGGPQYRAGSHRQFVLLARALAANGYASLRFDYRGMGDSEGEVRDFRGVGEDLREALRAFGTAVPEVRRVVVLGLCDAASAALMFAPELAQETPSVSGLVLLNPWVRSETGYAATQVKHYYGARLLQRGFWRKLISGAFDWRQAGRDFLRTLRLARKPGGPIAREEFQGHMARGLRRFNGPALLLLSGKDLVAREFVEYTGERPEWRELLNDKRLTRCNITEADHTFSCAAWRSQVEQLLLRWLQDTQGERAR